MIIDHVSSVKVLCLHDRIALPAASVIVIDDDRDGDCRPVTQKKKSPKAARTHARTQRLAAAAKAGRASAPLLPTQQVAAPNHSRPS